MSRNSWWDAAVAVMFVGIAVFLGYVTLRALMPAEWQFSIEAETEVAELNFRPGRETQWQIDGATICSSERLGVPDQYRTLSTPNRCSGRMQPGWIVSAPEQVVKLNGGSSVLIQTLPEGGYAMSLRAAEGEVLGTLSIVGIVDDVALKNRLDLFWTVDAVVARNYPFSGSTTLGRAVTWANDKLLKSGSVSVYTSDVSANQRSLVAETTLMLGDQVSLDAPTGSDLWPKGFLRVSREGGTFKAVLFGRADVLRIQRFGDSGYDFKPGFWSKMASDPRISFWGSVLMAYMTLILGLHPFVASRDNDKTSFGAIRRLSMWLQRIAK